MPRFVVLCTVSIASVFASACSDPAPKAPETYVYEGTLEPRTPPAALEDTGALGPPLEVSGSDSGHGGVLYSAMLGGYFLVRVQQADGSYKYEYKPDTDEWLWEDVIHRQIGPGYVAALLYGATGREEFRLSAEWSFEYGLPRARDAGDGELRVADLGGTSILVFGLSKLARLSEEAHAEYEPTLRALGAHLLASQDPETGDFPDANTAGYPMLVKGQVLQALAFLHLTLGDDEYLTALEEGSRFICHDYENTDESRRRYFVYYANEAFIHLYRESPGQWILDCSWSITDPLVDDQWTRGSTDRKSYWGGFGRASGSRPVWNASLWLEGIADAQALAMLAGDEARTERYRRSVQLGVPFVQRWQWRKGDTDDFPNPPEVVGGYPYLYRGSSGDFAWPLTRTDLSWHGSAMLLKAARLSEYEVFDELEETTAPGTAPIYAHLNSR